MSVRRTENSAFTLVEVLVAMVVLALISTGLLATTWRLVKVARDYVDQTVADSYCHDVLYAVAANTNRLGCGVGKSIWWYIDPTNDLPHIESVNLFQKTITVYPLWRSLDASHWPICRVAYPTASNFIVTVEWDWDAAGNSNRYTRTTTGTCP